MKVPWCRQLVMSRVTGQSHTFSVIALLGLYRNGSVPPLRMRDVALVLDCSICFDLSIGTRMAGSLKVCEAYGISSKGNTYGVKAMLITGLPDQYSTLR